MIAYYVGFATLAIGAGLCVELRIRHKRRIRHREIADALEKWAWTVGYNEKYEIMAAVAALRGEL